MGMISIERKDHVTIMRMDRGVTNAINIELILEIGQQLEAIEADGSSKAVVLTGNDKFFCIGFDLPTLIELDREGMGTFYRAVNKVSLDLFTYQLPTVAALMGHATAGGCILALCCDYRYMAEGRKLMGLNEIKLGLPVPYPADRVLTQMVGDRTAREIMGSGDFYESKESLVMGMVDRVLPLEKVLEAAIEKADAMGQMPQAAFQRIKGNRVEPVKGQVLARLEKREEAFLDMWFSNETQSLLKKAQKSF